eukprot:COSAG02_NODE_213_length_28704_cov_69.390177_2_plen_1270_part_00
MLSRARQELESGFSVTRFEVNSATGAVDRHRYELRLVGNRLQICSGTTAVLDLVASRLIDAHLGGAPACTELLRQARQAHLPPVAQPWRCFHFTVLEQVGGPSTADVVVHAEPYYCASPTSRQARLAVLGLMTIELAGRDDSCGRYKLLHKAAATRELVTMSAVETFVILPRESELLVHEIRTADGRPRARTDFGWVSVISQGGRTMAERVGESRIGILRPGPGFLLWNMAKLHLEALVPPGPFRRHGMFRVVASLLRQVARGVTLQTGNGAAYNHTANLPAVQRGWEELTSIEQVAAQTFGWSYSSWRRGTNVVPSWGSLNEIERSAASALKLGEDGWNGLREEQANRAVRREGMQPRRTEWLALDDVERASALWLGWTDSTWGQGSYPAVCSLMWTELSRDEREAVRTLGWSPTTWQEDCARHSLQRHVATSAPAAIALHEGESADYWLHVDTASIRVDALGSQRVDMMSKTAESPMFCRVWLDGKLVGDTRSVPAVPVAPIRVPGANQDELRQQLSQLGLSDLRRQAIGAGVSNDALEDALDHENPHEATLATTIEAMLRLSTPRISAAGDLRSSTPAATQWVAAELKWGEQIRLPGVANSSTIMTTLCIELYCQSLEAERGPPEQVHSHRSMPTSANANQISPPSRQELEARLGRLAKRDQRLATTFTLSPYKGVSSSIGMYLTQHSTPPRSQLPDDGAEHELEPEPEPEPTNVGDASGNTELLGVVILSGQGLDGFQAAASYVIQPLTSCFHQASVEGTLRLRVSSSEEAYCGPAVAHSQTAIEKAPLGSPVNTAGRHVRVTHDCVSWAALAVHEQSLSTGRNRCDDSEDPPIFISSSSIDAMVSKFGASSADLQGVPLVIVDPFLADTDQLVNADELKDAVVLCGRGSVPFIEKAKRLQACGAAAVVFVNTEDEPFCPLNSGRAQSSADDGVLIPAVCIQNTVGQNIVDRVRVSAAGKTMTASLILGQYGTQEQVADASVASASPPCKHGRFKSYIDTRASAREVSYALATPGRTDAGASKAKGGENGGSVQLTLTPQIVPFDSLLPHWEERHNLRLQAFAQLRPIMQQFVAKHAVPCAGASPQAAPTVSQADIKKMVAQLLPYCDKDRVVPACRHRCIDKASTATNGDDTGIASSPSLNTARHRNDDDGFTVDVVVKVFLSPAYLPTTCGQWDHLCGILSQWETWVVRRSVVVVKATLIFEDLNAAGTHLGTIREGEQVEVLESALSARGNVMSRVRRGGASPTGWVTTVKTNGAVLLVPMD